LPVERRIEAAKGVCKECKYESHCDRKKQKILECNLLVIQYFTEIKKGFNIYPYRGNLRNQALWFRSLYGHLQHQYSRIEEKNAQTRAKKMKGKK